MKNYVWLKNLPEKPSSMAGFSSTEFGNTKAMPDFYRKAESYI
ncbi:hypothetical protein [Calothrix sp. PCC 6303]|nr:hypothetical protein [Calothrix sp. PCC 6303]